MDRNTITGLVLIFLVMLAWGYFSIPSEQERAKMKAKQARQDSIAAAQVDSQKQISAQKPVQPKAQQDTSSAGGAGQQKTEQLEQTKTVSKSMFAQTGINSVSTVTIKTPLYKTTFTNRGAGPQTFTLLKYNTWDGQSLQLITDTTKSAYSLGFLTTNSYNVKTRNILFKQVTPVQKIKLKKGEKAQLKYVLPVKDGQRIVFTYTFYANKYNFDLDISFKGLSQTIIEQTIDFGYVSELNFTEKRFQRDANTASAYVYTGGELVQLRLSETGKKRKSFNGKIEWVSTRTQFFAQIIKSQSPVNGALLVGKRIDSGQKLAENFKYRSYLNTPIPKSGTIELGLYLGPLSAHKLKGFAGTAYSMVDVGYSWTSWFSEPLVRWIILPFFRLVSDYMGVGLAIILFAILVKLILYPFTKKSFKSMGAMKELQPKMKEIQNKYDDDPKKQQEETMKLYKEAGVNPIGGCLPMLLQFPILITLWRFFQNSILIRGEEFLWANDLSAPDYIINLPFEIPFIGDQLAGFVILMSIAMVFQTQLTGGMSGSGGGAGKGPMKMLKYIFPLMMLFIFNNFAAGLSLYYLIYNLMSIGQQLIINKELEEDNEIEKAIAS